MNYTYVPLKLRNEVYRIKKACGMTVRILDELSLMLRPGVTTLDIASGCDRIIKRNGAVAGLKGYKGFPASVCISVNHVAAHGVPNSYELKDGDIVTLDLTAGVDGWFGDCSKTYAVGKISDEKKALIEAARNVTNAGINAAEAGCRMGDIGAAIEDAAASAGLTVLKNFIGHGIGRDIHEEPAVLHCGEAGSGRPVVPGMVFTIEPILTPGRDLVETLADGWTIVTKDRTPCAQFEHTIAIFGSSTEILTQ